MQEIINIRRRMWWLLLCFHGPLGSSLNETHYQYMRGKEFVLNRNRVLDELLDKW